MKGDGDFIRRFMQNYIKKLLKSGSGMFSSLWLFSQRSVDTFEDRIVSDFFRNRFAGFLERHQFFPEFNVLTEFFHDFLSVFRCTEFLAGGSNLVIDLRKIAFDQFGF